MLPKVTIAMPAFNEEHYIERCIRTVQEQDYPRDRIEVLIADGRSTDQTRAIIDRLAVEDPRIKLIDNPDKLQASGLNRIVRAATGEIVVRMDVHCEYAPDYVRRAVEVMEKTGADNVGGAQRAKANTTFQRALCAALASPLGVGGAKYRSPEAEGFVDTVFLGAFRRRVFETVGMWDPGAITNEDAELNQRILAAGGRVFLSRELVVHYFPRDSIKTLAQQYFRYGRGRARTLLKLGSFPTLRPLLPFVMVSGAAAMLVTPPLWPVAPVAIGAYLLATGAEAIRVGAPMGVGQIPTVWAIFPVLHASHGIGFAAGLWRYLRSPDWPRTAADVELLPKRATLRAV
ncbi:MAG: glycosyltransferase family 2 protein [Kofleriaceae bacterium]|nr:glycosyltransferase family 2 protein [Kofleriaceae bacterium]